MKDIRFHLWDIFVYLGVGTMAASIALLHEALFSSERFVEIGKHILANSTSTVTIGALVALALLGTLIEPIANAFEKFIALPLAKLFFRGMKRIAQILRRRKFASWVRRHRALLSPPKLWKIEAFIKSRYIGEFWSGSPYAFCKEYVEGKGLSATFMTFLSKQGYYRSISLLFFCWACLMVGGTVFSVYAGSLPLVVAVLSAATSAICFWRSQKFFALQASSIYSAFLIPHVARHLEEPSPSTTVRKK